MARKTKEDTKMTREMIMKAALDLFIERGYDRTTLDDIARAVGLSKGAVYWHFENKQALLSKLILTVVERHDKETKEKIEKPASPEKLVENLIYHANITLTRDEDRKFFLMMTRLDWASPEMSEIKDELVQLDVDIISTLRKYLVKFKEGGMIKPDVNVEEIAMVLASIWMGLLKGRLCGTSFNLEHTLRTGLNLVFQGIVK
ncbi:MAG: TetR family transcriptional regulator [Kiritimatiellae bacterium]|nr:TetR family transcriptional regulator [Kiritimatiellia bacterium]